MTEAVINFQHNLDLKIGTGLIDSYNLLYREVSRSVDWIFTNQAELLTQKIKEDLTK